MLLPASTGSGESDLVTDRSAEVLTFVVSVAELLPGVGSATFEVTLTVLVMSAVREESTLTTKVTCAEPPEAIVPRDQVTVPAVFVPPPVAETKLVAGRSGVEGMSADVGGGRVFLKVTVLVMSAVREESTLTTKVTCAEPPEAIVPRDQVTVPAVFVPPPVAETKLVPA